MTSFDSRARRTLFWGLMRAQIITLVIFAILATVLAGTIVGLSAVWGGTICLLAHGWAGFQVWLHPRNRDAQNQMGAVIRAETGKIAIMLLLLWLSFKQWPHLRGQYPAAALLVNFFLVQVVGWIWLARATGAPPGGDASGKHDG